MGHYEKWDAKTGKMMRGYVIETIADHAKDHRFAALCGDCRHSKPIDMGYWIEKLGADYMMSRFRKRFRCANCGSKDVHLVGSYQKEKKG